MVDEHWWLTLVTYGFSCAREARTSLCKLFRATLSTGIYTGVGIILTIESAIECVGVLCRVVVSLLIQMLKTLLNSPRYSVATPRVPG